MLLLIKLLLLFLELSETGEVKDSRSTSTTLTGVGQAAVDTGSGGMRGGDTVGVGNDSCSATTISNLERHGELRRSVTIEPS